VTTDGSRHGLLVIFFGSILEIEPKKKRGETSTA
jgi:hypothetical protein